MLDDVVANLVGGLQEAFESRITSMVNDLKSAIGAPVSQPGTRAPIVSTEPPPAPVIPLADRAAGDVVGGVQPLRAD